MLYERVVRTGLSVSEYTSVVTLKRIVQNVTTQGIENDVLAREIVRARIQRVETVIEGKDLRLVPVTTISKMYIISSYHYSIALFEGKSWLRASLSQMLHVEKRVMSMLYNVVRINQNNIS